jgi:hypothetical protein
VINIFFPVILSEHFMRVEGPRLINLINVI